MYILLHYDYAGTQRRLLLLLRLQNPLSYSLKSDNLAAQQKQNAGRVRYQYSPTDVTSSSSECRNVFNTLDLRTDGFASVAQSAASWSGYRRARLSPAQPGSDSQCAAKNGRREADCRPPGSWSTQLSTKEGKNGDAAVNWATVLSTLDRGNHPLHGEKGRQVSRVGGDDDEGEEPPHSPDDAAGERSERRKQSRQSDMRAESTAQGGGGRTLLHRASCVRHVIGREV
ncbi:hypothetical protein EYF80_000996 [Liparis tanakae]|uniref:Uncharacterized protein n=1 Tax=Liparis tanakae TaxID=230148 RepID=A0A4Z2JFT5_9TELE|nr:hypothetical protein EYF80_000996 [Liparis tanakae]